jgi:tellurite resistance protein TerC
MHVTTLAWVLTVGLASVFLLLDVFWIGRRPHEPSMRECALVLTFYVVLAVVFGIGVWWKSGGTYAGQFFAGWLTEYSLSIDNLFVFLIIMSRFAVPRALQQTAAGSSTCSARSSCTPR